MLLDIAEEAGHDPVQESRAPGAWAPADAGSPTLLERYAPLMPFQSLHAQLSLGEGGTPLVEAPRLAVELGAGRVFIKNEGLNPTGSFKDRGTISGIHRALELGFRAVGTVSTGNMAHSVAAYAARAGLPCFVLVQKGISPGKLAALAAWGPTVVEVEGDYGQLYEVSLRLGRERGIYFINSDDPFRVEGQKTLAFEILEGLARLRETAAPPPIVLLPVSSGGNLAAFLKGLRELAALGRLPDHLRPRVIGVQAEGCAPIARAVNAGETVVRPWEHVETVAHAISNPRPPSGNRIARLALQARRQGEVAAAVPAPGKEGAAQGQDPPGLPFTLEMVTAPEEEILRAYAEMPQLTGVFGQPDSAVPLAAARQLAREGKLRPGQVLVLVATGHGWKDIDGTRHLKGKRLSGAIEELGRLL